MKRLFTLLLGVLAMSGTQASHLVSLEGNATYDGLQSNGKHQYTINLSFFRNEANSPVKFDDNIDLGIYKAANLQLIATTRLSLNKEQRILAFTGRYWKATYQGLLQVSQQGDFIIQYRRCCMTESNNLIDDQGLDLSIYVPDFLAQGQATSNLVHNPLFVAAPQQTIEIDSIWTFPWADSVAIDFGTLYRGGSASDLNPTPSLTYFTDSSSRHYRAGFSYQKPLASNGLMQTYLSSVTLMPPNPGIYYIPLNYRVFRQGQSYTYNVVLYLISSHELPSLFLEFDHFQQNNVRLNAHANKAFSSFELQKSTDTYFPLGSGIQTLGYAPIQQLNDVVSSSQRFWYYRLRGELNGQTYTSNTVKVDYSLTSAFENPSSERWPIYPNPASYMFRLESPIVGPYLIANSNGQVLQSGTLVEGENEINLSKLAPGLYWVQTAQGTQKLSIVR